MLRTNCKKAIENIRKYIIDNFDNSGYELPTASDFSEVAKQIYNTFYSEVGKYNEKRRMSRQESFAEWCSGLPSILDCCYYYNRSAIDDLKVILEETNEEANKYTEEKAENLLTNLIYREITKYC